MTRGDLFSVSRSVWGSIVPFLERRGGSGLWRMIGRSVYSSGR